MLSLSWAAIGRLGQTFTVCSKGLSLISQITKMKAQKGQGQTVKELVKTTKIVRVGVLEISNKGISKYSIWVTLPKTPSKWAYGNLK